MMIQEVIYYVTSDGTKFEDEYEASEYELNRLTANLNAKDLIMIDDNGHSYSPSTEFVAGLKKAVFMYIKTEKALNAIQEVSSYLNIEAPEKLGIFRYETEWIDLEEDLKYLNETCWRGFIKFDYKILGQQEE